MSWFWVEWGRERGKKRGILYGLLGRLTKTYSCLELNPILINELHFFPLKQADTVECVRICMLVYSRPSVSAGFMSMGSSSVDTDGQLYTFLTFYSSYLCPVFDRDANELLPIFPNVPPPYRLMLMHFTCFPSPNTHTHTITLILANSSQSSALS